MSIESKRTTTFDAGNKTAMGKGNCFDVKKQLFDSQKWSIIVLVLFDHGTVSEQDAHEWTSMLGFTARTLNQIYGNCILIPNLD